MAARGKERAKTNLPHPLTSFVGREREMAEVRSLLDQSRLLTLTGAGGCGKTRLALHVAAGLFKERAFEHGVWLVELAALTEAESIPLAVAATQGIREQPGRTPFESLTAALEPKTLLLILDNCEHLAGACAEWAETLLRACPNLKILATSREVLRVAGEIVWPVPPLGLPDLRQLPAPGASAGLADALKPYESVRLFVERARASHGSPAFTLTDQNARAVAQVCHQLDGMPLAIELAAARTRVLSVGQIAARLRDHLSLLTVGSRTAPPRQQTMRATIAWSHDLLEEIERVLFRRLSVFAGGFTLEAVEAVCGPELHAAGEPAREGLDADGWRRWQALDCLSRLIEKSLVLADGDGQAGEKRYRLLETVRQFARDKLLEAGEAAAWQGRHFAFYLAFAETAGGALWGQEQAAWAKRLQAEHDNLRAALAWALGSAEMEAALRLAGALTLFWVRQGYLAEGNGWWAKLLAAGGGVSPTARGVALLEAATLAQQAGAYDHAIVLADQALGVGRETDNQLVIAKALLRRGTAIHLQGDHGTAATLMEESLRLTTASGDQKLAAETMRWLADARMRQGDFKRAEPLWEESLALGQELGDHWGLTFSLGGLGDIARLRGDYERATALFQESINAKWESGAGGDIFFPLESLALTATAQGQARRAARLWGAAEALREAASALLPPAYRESYVPYFADVRAQLGEEAFAAAWAQGKAMAPAQAVEYALSPGPAGIRSPTVAADRLEVNALGAARVVRGGQVLTASEWTYAKARELLFYLLCHPGRTKEQIGLALWPDASPAQLRQSLHPALHHLRRALGRPDRIVFESEQYAFNRSLPYWFDVEAFDERLAEAQRLLRAHSQEPARAVPGFEAAVQLYQGDLLEGLAEADWHLPRQEELRRRYLNALLTLGRLYFDQANYTRAAEVYHTAIARESFLEAAHCDLMRCYVRLGETGQALRHYQYLADLLQDELGSPPAPETAALFERLRRGEPV